MENKCGQIEKNLRKDVKRWISGASSDEIARVIEIGYMSSQIAQKREQQAIAVEKGKLGEEYVYEILSKEYKMKDTSKSAHAGDLQLKTEHGHILVEVKNYANTIPKHQVDKFLNDLKHNNRIKAGLFISLYAKIVGIPQKIYFEEHLVRGRKIPILYVCTNVESIITLMVDILVNQLKLKQQYHSNAELIVYKLKQLDDDLNILSQVHSKLEELNKSVQHSLNNIQELVRTAELGLYRTIQDIHNTIDWKKHISQETFNQLWEFVSDKFDIVYPNRFKKMLKKLYKSYPSWSYGSNFIMSQTTRKNRENNNRENEIQFIFESDTRIKFKTSDLTDLPKKSIYENGFITVPLVKHNVSWIKHRLNF